MAQIHALTPEGRLPSAAIEHVEEIAVPRTTGWRNITSFAPDYVSGRLLIKRTGETVTVIFDDLVLSGSGNLSFTRLPSGFYPWHRVRETWQRGLANMPVGTLNITTAAYFNIYGVAPGELMNARFQYEIPPGAIWPPSLPGVPA